MSLSKERKREYALIGIPALALGVIAAMAIGYVTEFAPRGEDNMIHVGGPGSLLWVNVLAMTGISAGVSAVPLGITFFGMVANDGLYKLGESIGKMTSK